MGVACLGGRRTVILGRSAVFHIFVRLQHGAVPVLPDNRVGVDGIVEHGGVLRFTSDRLNLRCPATEGVGMLCIADTGGRLAGVGGNFTIGHLLRLQHGVIPVLPGDGVLIDSLCVNSFVGNVASHGGNRRIPASEGVGILGIAGLGGRLAVVFRRSAIGHILVLLQFGTVDISPCYGVSVCLCGVFCSIGHISCYFRYCRCPSFKGITSFGRRW